MPPIANTIKSHLRPSDFFRKKTKSYILQKMNEKMQSWSPYYVWEFPQPQKSKLVWIEKLPKPQLLQECNRMSRKIHSYISLNLRLTINLILILILILNFNISPSASSVGEVQ